MGEVDLNFRPSVPVFDANVALGRQHDRLVRVDTADGTLEAMGRAGVERALVYSPHAANYDSLEGNELLLGMVQGHSSLTPQFVCNPAFDDLDAFASTAQRHGVRSVRMVLMLHGYPFREWVVKPWLDWLAAEGIPLWLPASFGFQQRTHEIDPAPLHDTIAVHPGLRVVLSEVHYRHLPWALPMLRSLPNVSIDISWHYSTDGISMLMDAVGEGRILFGSRFPDAPMAPQLYQLHRCGLSKAALEALCSGNLERLLAKG